MDEPSMETVGLFGQGQGAQVQSAQQIAALLTSSSRERVERIRARIARGSYPEPFALEIVVDRLLAELVPSDVPMPGPRHKKADGTTWGGMCVGRCPANAIVDPTVHSAGDVIRLHVLGRVLPPQR